MAAFAWHDSFASCPYTQCQTIRPLIHYSMVSWKAWICFSVLWQHGIFPLRLQMWHMVFDVDLTEFFNVLLSITHSKAYTGQCERATGLLGYVEIECCGGWPLNIAGFIFFVLLKLLLALTSHLFNILPRSWTWLDSGDRQKTSYQFVLMNYIWCDTLYNFRCGLRSGMDMFLVYFCFEIVVIKLC